MDEIAMEAEESAERGHLKGVYDAAKALDTVKDKNGKLLTAED